MRAKAAAEEYELPPFQSAEHALRFAFGLEATDGYRLGCVDGGLGGDLDLMERIAQASLVISHAKQNLPDILRSAVVALYTVGKGPSLLGRKELECRMLSWWLYEITGRPRWWLCDEARRWAGMRMQHDDDWWQEHLQRKERTLYYWRSGRNGQKGVLQQLDVWHSAALSVLGATMQQAGLTP